MEGKPGMGFIPSCFEKLEKWTGGYDAGKKIDGRKPHVVLDRIGLILAVVVHAPNVQQHD